MKRFTKVRSDNSSIVFTTDYSDLKNYLPAFNESTNETEFCAIRFDYMKSDSNRIPIFIEVLRYLHKGTDYGSDTIKNDNKDMDFAPIDIRFKGLILLDKDNNKYYLKKREIQLEKLLNILYRAHTRNSRKVAGLWTRLRIKLKRQIIAKSEYVIKFFEFLLDKTFGRIIEKNDVMEEMYCKPITPQMIRIKDKDFIKFAHGYECTKSVAFISSLIIVLLVIICNKYQILIKNTFMNVLFLPLWIILLYILDKGIPLLIIFIINRLIKYRINENIRIRL